MSSENLLEFASSFETLYVETSKLIEDLDLGKIKLEKLSSAKENLTELDYFINQMELELSLMPPEDSEGVEINKTCRGHYNDLRKKIDKIETQGPSQSRKNKRKISKDENDILGGNNTTITYPDVDHSRMNNTGTTRSTASNSTMSTENSMDDLRSKYGVPQDISLYGDEK